MKLILATTNPGKLREIQQLLAGEPITLLLQSDFGIPDADETGLSFIENAILKARHASQATGLPALADDSGLEVDALNGAPGIYSARYAGDHASAADHIAKLLYALKGVPQSSRTARFQCAMAFLRHAHDPSPIIVQAAWEGFILEAPQGQGGHGYDPIFYVPTHHCSAAELLPEEKNRISHRGQALGLLKKIFQHLHFS